MCSWATEDVFNRNLENINKIRYQPYYNYQEETASIQEAQRYKLKHINLEFKDQITTLMRDYVEKLKKTFYWKQAIFSSQNISRINENFETLYDALNPIELHADTNTERIINIMDISLDMFRNYHVDMSRIIRILDRPTKPIDEEDIRELRKVMNVNEDNNGNVMLYFIRDSKDDKNHLLCKFWKDDDLQCRDNALRCRFSHLDKRRKITR